MTFESTVRAVVQYVVDFSLWFPLSFVSSLQWQGGFPLCSPSKDLVTKIISADNVGQSKLRCCLPTSIDQLVIPRVSSLRHIV